MVTPTSRLGIGLIAGLLAAASGAQAAAGEWPIRVSVGDDGVEVMSNLPQYGMAPAVPPTATRHPAPVEPPPRLALQMAEGDATAELSAGQPPISLGKSFVFGD